MPHMCRYVEVQSTYRQFRENKPDRRPWEPGGREPLFGDLIASAEPRLVVDLTAHLSLRRIEDEHEDEDEHEEDEHGHHHGEFDPHVWMAPTLVAVWTEEIAEALAEVHPEHGADYASARTRLPASCMRWTRGYGTGWESAVTMPSSVRANSASVVPQPPKEYLEYLRVRPLRKGRIILHVPNGPILPWRRAVMAAVAAALFLLIRCADDVDRVRKRAENGNATAQRRLGYYYSLGEGVSAESCRSGSLVSARS